LAACAEVGVTTLQVNPLTAGRNEYIAFVEDLLTLRA
jgi:hypothetical protein